MVILVKDSMYFDGNYGKRFNVFLTDSETDEETNIYEDTKEETRDYDGGRDYEGYKLERKCSLFHISLVFPLLRL